MASQGRHANEYLVKLIYTYAQIQAEIDAKKHVEHKQIVWKKRKEVVTKCCSLFQYYMIVFWILCLAMVFIICMWLLLMYKKNDFANWDGPPRFTGLPVDAEIVDVIYNGMIIKVPKHWVDNKK
jgi:hypothetical protein